MLIENEQYRQSSKTLAISPLQDAISIYRKSTDPALFSTKLSKEMMLDLLHKNQDIDISDPTTYLKYLENIQKEHCQKYGRLANKANVQLECQKLGINEDTTRMIDPNDLSILFRYVQKLTNEGRIVWIGSSTVDDMTDPNTDKSNKNHSVTPPLYKKITSLDDLQIILPSINMFHHSHPDMLLKVFPQDKVNPTLTSIVFENNSQSKKISFHFKPGQFTPDGLRSEKPSKTIDIEVDMSQNIPIISISNKEDLEWVDIVINSLAMFEKIETIDFGNTPVINVEAMHINGDPSLSFVTDIIYGNGNKTTDYLPIPMTQMLKSLKSGIVAYKNSPIDIKAMVIDPNNLIYHLIDRALYTLNPQNTKKCISILQVIKALDLIKMHIYIPPSIIRNLESLANGRQPTQPISKALIHLQNSLTVPIGDVQENDKMKSILVDDHVNKWKIIS